MYGILIDNILQIGKERMNVKEYFFALGLMSIEIVCFYFFTLVFDLSLDFCIKLLLIWLIIMFVFKHYKVQSTLVWDEILNNIKSFICFVLIGCVIYPNKECYSYIVCLGFFMFICAVFINRMIRILFRDFLARKTIIIGTGDEAYRIGKIANNNRFALTDVIGYFYFNDNDLKDFQLKHGRVFQLFNYNELDSVLEKNKVKQVIIALPDATKKQIDTISKDLFDKVEFIKILPQLNFTMTFNSRIDDFDGELLISTSRGRMDFFSRFIKRCIDIIVGFLGCLTLLPLSLWISYKNRKNGDKEPLIFKQKRIGKDGKEIFIYKYRSMIPNAEQVLEELMKNDPKIRDEYLKNKKLINDPRVTKVGKFLRKTSLDEFPQFFNVLKGDMSLVGPRPYLFREKDDMDIYYESIIQCKPGITGMWQANGRSDVSFEERCKLDDYYYRNWSLGLDFIIIYKTIKSVIYGKGAL